MGGFHLTHIGIHKDGHPHAQAFQLVNYTAKQFLVVHHVPAGVAGELCG